MGTGHPYYDGAGKRVETPSESAFRYVGGQDTWERLSKGETAYQLIETREDFEKLAAGDLELEGGKVLGLAQNARTLQFSRPGVTMGEKLATSPALATMTAAALGVLDDNENGFFLMVEGGASDWAAHANNLPRLIEEQMEFNEAVKTVVNWVEENSDWDETLVIITSDHGNGLLQGPNSDKAAYEPIVNQGAGALPLVRWHSSTHTRELVPLYAHGAGADLFIELGEREDGLAIYEVDEDSRIWVDNTDVIRVTLSAFGIEETK